MSNSVSRSSTLRDKEDNNISSAKPDLSDIINLHDFERVASQTLSEKSWAYISSGSNDNITRDANLAILKKIWLRPAVMRNVQHVNTKTTLFSYHLDLPIFIAPTGAVCTAGPDEILNATTEHAFFQVYVNKTRAETERVLRLGIATGKVKAIFVTADLPVVSKREADERVKSSANTSDAKGAGLARQTGAFIDPSLNWDDIGWIRSITNLPIVVKGIQRWEDAKLAVQYGCQGIILSNHGGRAADNALPAIITLLELHVHCPEVFGNLEILVDGGFRRGSDIVKAICLGASAVGLGRPFMYAVNYGQRGVEHAVNILRDEIETTMRLCGIKDLMQDSDPSCLNTAEVDHLVYKPNHLLTEPLLWTNIEFHHQSFHLLSDSRHPSPKTPAVQRFYCGEPDSEYSGACKAEGFFNMLQDLLHENVDRLKQLCARVESICTALSLDMNFWQFLPYFINITSLELYGDPWDRYRGGHRPFDMPATLLTKLHYVRLDGEIPRHIVAWILSSCASDERLELALLDTGITTEETIEDDFPRFPEDIFTPPEYPEYRRLSG
ncbi:hypothetical protein FPOA_06738 [Fusarium poae]|uniref:FMN hydroxy acid dehydrogenase domain-containing protein n=1 Tax=Fusarium poae TaxID=36050 RepID=A0A1B8AJ78_FUSPO|nr:hypothetical protein FPOA_06738 [Fusarium poae]